MKDYSVSITFRASIQARNEEQAQERASMVEDALANGNPGLDKLQKSKSWLGDLESGTLVKKVVD